MSEDRLLQDIEQDISEHEAVLVLLKKERQDHLRLTLLSCEHCNERTRISKLVYIQTHRYEASPSWNYWVPSKGQYICPKCGEENPILDFNEELKLYFAKVAHKYER